MKTFRKSAVSILLVLSAVARLTTAHAQSGRAFMWVAQSNTATGYLLGSLHAAQKDLYPLDQRIENAFAKSHTLVVEVDESEMGPQVQLQLAAKGMYPLGDTLDKHIS